MHRDVLLTNEVYIVVLRLVQLRDHYVKFKSGLRIESIKYFGKELKLSDVLLTKDLSKISVEEAVKIGKSIGYGGMKRGFKTDITIDGKNYGIRCLNYTDRALINHSHRRKYESICKLLHLDISILDNIISDYWDRRTLKIFNEDCYSYSPLNPFLGHKEFLTELLTFMAFHSFDFNQNYDSDEFIKDSCDFILDFIDPWDDSTWKIYNPTNYLDSIWDSLCFSMRDRKGMPSDDVLLLPENNDIMRWTCLMGGRYKGALHVRVKKYNASEKGKLFIEKYKEEILKVKYNIGERDEYLLKLFLVECRYKQIAIPLGEKIEVVRTVGSSKKEYDNPTLWLKWDSLEPKDIVFMCKSIGANKSGKYSKADVFINGIGISVKSRRGASPSLINHTTRDKILRVMNAINSPIAPLDRIISNYWTLRNSSLISEDVDNTNPNSPFKDNILVLKPLLDYFAFDGTGSRDSEEPANYVLSLGIPSDVSTWVYYSKEDYIVNIWDNLKFSIRSKETPQDPKKINELMLPWIQEINGKKKGSLSVRVNK